MAGDAVTYPCCVYVWAERTPPRYIGWVDAVVPEDHLVRCCDCGTCVACRPDGCPDSVRSDGKHDWTVYVGDPCPHTFVPPEAVALVEARSNATPEPVAPIPSLNEYTPRAPLPSWDSIRDRFGGSGESFSISGRLDPDNPPPLPPPFPAHIAGRYLLLPDTPENRAAHPNASDLVISLDPEGTADGQ